MVYTSTENLNCFGFGDLGQKFSCPHKNVDNEEQSADIPQNGFNGNNNRMEIMVIWKEKGTEEQAETSSKDVGLNASDEVSE
ncbi:MAG: hypothetical protein ACRCZO_19690 [Cetobacterium sp.]